MTYRTEQDDRESGRCLDEEVERYLPAWLKTLDVYLGSYRDSERTRYRRSCRTYSSDA